MLKQVQGIPRVLIRLARQVSPHDLVMGGISRADSQHYPFEYSCLENPMDREPGVLQFMGLQRVDMNECLSTDRQRGRSRSLGGE